MDTYLGTEASRTLTSTADDRGRVEEVEHFLIDFDTAFNNCLEFSSSLHGHDDPNIVDSRARLH